MKHIINILKGMAFGIANIIPGVSGGTMAVITKVYDKLLSVFSLDFKAIKKHFIFIVFYGIGAVLGVGLGAVGLSELFENFYVPTQMFFTGVIVGSLPLIAKECVKEKPFAKINIIPLAVGIIGMVIFSLGKESSAMSMPDEITVPFALMMIAYLFIAAVAMILPGLSGSMVLLMLGVYPLALGAVKDLNIPVILILCVGAGLGLVIGSRIIKILLNKFHQGTYCVILGLVIGSVYAIFPFREIALNAQLVAGVICLAAGLVIPTIMEKLGENRENKKSGE